MQWYFLSKLKCSRIDGVCGVTKISYLIAATVIVEMLERTICTIYSICSNSYLLQLSLT